MELFKTYEQLDKQEEYVKFKNVVFYFGSTNLLIEIVTVYLFMYWFCEF